MHRCWVQNICDSILKNLTSVLKEWLSKTVNLTLENILNHSRTGTCVCSHNHFLNTKAKVS